MSDNRTGSVERETKESRVQVAVDIDGTGVTDISTGIGFFDHMLGQLGKPLRRQVQVNNKLNAHTTTSGSSRSSSRQAA